MTIRQPPVLSLVIPFFNEGGCIDRVCNEVQQVLSGKITNR